MATVTSKSYAILDIDSICTVTYGTPNTWVFKTDVLKALTAILDANMAIILYFESFNKKPSELETLLNEISNEITLFGNLYKETTYKSYIYYSYLIMASNHPKVKPATTPMEFATDPNLSGSFIIGDHADFATIATAEGITRFTLTAFLATL